MPIEDKDMGMAKILRELVAMNGAEILVGIQAEEDSDLLTIAAANEFGTEDGHIPERSFLRGTFDERQAEIGIVVDRVFDKILSGGKSALLLQQVGLGVVAMVKKRIKARIDPENAESTIKAKGSDLPLVDKGRLINSIRAKTITSGGVFTSPTGDFTP